MSLTQRERLDAALAQIDAIVRHAQRILRDDELGEQSRIDAGFILDDARRARHHVCKVAGRPS